LCLYEQYFSSLDDETGQPLVVQRPLLSFSLQDVDSGDLGMEMEHKLSPNDLALMSLDFICDNNLPHQFNKFRHKTGITPWENSDAFKPSSQNSQNLVPLSLHQLAGVHSIIQLYATHSHGSLYLITVMQ
jgi:hypothetical protein